MIIGVDPHKSTHTATAAHAVTNTAVSWPKHTGNRAYQATDIINCYEDLATINPPWQCGRRRQRHWPTPPTRSRRESCPGLKSPGR